MSRFRGKPVSSINDIPKETIDRIGKAYDTYNEYEKNKLFPPDQPQEKKPQSKEKKPRKKSERCTMTNQNDYHDEMVMAKDENKQLLKYIKQLEKHIVKLEK